LTRTTGSRRRALALVGLSRSTWHYRSKPRTPVIDPVRHTDRAYPSRISATDRAVIADKISTGWQQGHSVDHSFADCWDEGIMLASRRSWWRIAARIADQNTRPAVPKRSTNTTPRSAPVLEATGPGQVWSWDITDLHSPWRGASYKAYSIIDIYSRMIVGWRVEDRESDHLAVDMFAQAFTRHGPPQAVHADSGPAMRSTLLKDFLTDHGVTQTHNRPRVSNDNPFSESEFRTMKYRPHYPGIFTDTDTARTWVGDYAPWYNQQHHHSGIALFTPAQVHDGTWEHIWHQRDHTQQAYYNTHPERFRKPPTTPTPNPTVGINLPTKMTPD
jgi:putative transposase